MQEKDEALRRAVSDTELQEKILAQNKGVFLCRKKGTQGWSGGWTNNVALFKDGIVKMYSVHDSGDVAANDNKSFSLKPVTEAERASIPEEFIIDDCAFFEITGREATAGTVRNWIGNEYKNTDFFPRDFAERVSESIKKQLS